MLSLEQVKHVARLARLELRPKELIKFQKELSSIFAFFEKLGEIDTEKLQPDFYLNERINLEKGLRSDEARPQSEETVKSLIESVPETKDGCLKVKSVF